MIKKTVIGAACAVLGSAYNLGSFLGSVSPADDIEKAI
jgi:hypothetical protein